MPLQPTFDTASMLPHAKFRACAAACNEAVVAAEYCAAECLRESAVARLTRCIELTRSCADYCAFAVREMSRGSEFARRLCCICAQVCQACGDECAKHPMSHCQECARACHRCAEECRRLAPSGA